MRLYEIIYSFDDGAVIEYRKEYFKCFSKRALLRYVYNNCKAYEDIESIKLLSYAE